MEVVERPLKSADEITAILGALNALKRGDASVRLPAEWHGVLGRVADVFNDSPTLAAALGNTAAALPPVADRERSHTSAPRMTTCTTPMS